MSLKITGCQAIAKRPTRSLVSKIPRLLSLLLAAGILVCLMGCGVQQLTRGELQPPKVTFKSLAFGLPTAQGLPLECTLLVANPNPQDLRILGYDYELQLEGQEVLRGESRGEVTLPARGQTLVTVPILVKLRALPGLLPSILKDEKLHYQVAGGVRLASLLGGFRVPFHFQGQMTPKEGREQLRLYLK
jgi:LEA14-like dessication related protein